MIFPLKKRRLTLDASGHLKQGRGVATDYIASYEDLYAPYDGVVSNFQEVQGGNWIKLTRPNGDKIEFAHLSKYIKQAPVKAGDLIAITGNTGQITTGPHLHVQIFVNGQRVDPEKYFMDRLVKASKDVFRLRNGEKDLFLNKESFEALDGRWASIETITQSELDAIPDGFVLIAVKSE